MTKTKTVPIEPTEEMKLAWHSDKTGSFDKAYKAMLEAAPPVEDDAIAMDNGSSISFTGDSEKISSLVEPDNAEAFNIGEIAHIIQDWGLKNGFTFVASEAQDLEYALIAALTNQSIQGWRDISTAPKDGTFVDLWVKREHEHGNIEYVRRPNMQWGTITDMLTGDVYEGWRGLKKMYTVETPLYWRHIPLPPEQKGE